jgi:hypothetical protein
MVSIVDCAVSRTLMPLLNAPAARRGRSRSRDDDVHVARNRRCPCHAEGDAVLDDLLAGFGDRVTERVEGARNDRLDVAHVGGIAEALHLGRREVGGEAVHDSERRRVATFSDAVRAELADGAAGRDEVALAFRPKMPWSSKKECPMGGTS